MIKDKLKNLNIPSITYYNHKFNELKEQFIEMGQLKSDFDIEKFTVKKQGNFIAHQFHFLMRQYSLAMSEARRMIIERDRKLRQITRLSEKKSDDYDLDILQLENEIDLLEITMTNKIIMCEQFEKARLKIIENNGGKVPTNGDHQREEPEYWKWFIEQKAKEQISARNTGINEGIWESIRMLQEPALINDDFQVKLLNEQGLLYLGEDNAK